MCTTQVYAARNRLVARLLLHRRHMVHTLYDALVLASAQLAIMQKGKERRGNTELEKLKPVHDRDRMSTCPLERGFQNRGCKASSTRIGRRTYSPHAIYSLSFQSRGVQDRPVPVAERRQQHRASAWISKKRARTPNSRKSSFLKTPFPRAHFEQPCASPDEVVKKILYAKGVFKRLLFSYFSR